MSFRIISLAIALALAAATARAERPQLGIPHTGRLLGDGDAPVVGDRDFTFTLYRTATGGELVWQETRKVHLDEQGLYALTLGDPGIANSPPLTQDLFDGALYLGIKVGVDPELQPRLPVGLVPFAARAERADLVDGGVIRNATVEASTVKGGSLEGAAIKGGTIENASLKTVTVEGGTLKTVSIEGGTLDSVDVRALSLSANTFAAKDIALQGSLSVAGSGLVTNLNAEMVGGKKAGDFVLKSELGAAGFVKKEEFLDVTFANLVNNGAMDRWDPKAAAPSNTMPNRYEKLGAWNATAQSGVMAVLGYGSADSLAVVDGDTANRVAVQQTLLASVAGLGGTKFALSVHGRKQSGAASVVGRACLRDADAGAGSETCAPITTSGAWTRATLTHTLSANAAYLKVALYATGTDVSETAEVNFDDLVVVRGAEPVSFRPSSADATPAGLISYFAGACPTGWVEYQNARGRVVVGNGATAGDVGSTFGTALGTKAARNVTLTLAQLPAHTHKVNPPSTSTTSNGSHLHDVNPPSISTANSGDHSHSYSDNSGWSCDNTPSSTDRTCGESGNRYDQSRSTGTTGSHSHTVDIGSFNSGSAGDHTHTLDIAEFDSGAAGSGAAVDVTMPYVQLTACKSL